LSWRNYRKIKLNAHYTDSERHHVSASKQTKRPVLSVREMDLHFSKIVKRPCRHWKEQ